MSTLHYSTSELVLPYPPLTVSKCYPRGLLSSHCSSALSRDCHHIGHYKLLLSHSWHMNWPLIPRLSPIRVKDIRCKCEGFTKAANVKVHIACEQFNVIVGLHWRVPSDTHTLLSKGLHCGVHCPWNTRWREAGQKSLLTQDWTALGTLEWSQIHPALWKLHTSTTGPKAMVHYYTLWQPRTVWTNSPN